MSLLSVSVAPAATRIAPPSAVLPPSAPLPPAPPAVPEVPFVPLPSGAAPFVPDWPLVPAVPSTGLPGNGALACVKLEMSRFERLTVPPLIVMKRPLATYPSRETLCPVLTSTLRSLETVIGLVKSTKLRPAPQSKM